MLLVALSTVFNKTVANQATNNNSVSTGVCCGV
jgi:hypothetical protein